MQMNETVFEQQATTTFPISLQMEVLSNSLEVSWLTSLNFRLIPDIISPLTLLWVSTEIFIKYIQIYLLG